MDRDPTTINQGVFKHLNRADDQSQRSRSDGWDLTETVHDGSFHRNRRSKRSDGYAQNCYKTKCSSSLYVFELDFKQIELSRHHSSCFS